MCCALFHLQTHSLRLRGRAPDHECATQQILFRHKTPVAAVAAAVTIVTHRKVVPSRYRAYESAIIVLTGFPMRERAHYRELDRSRIGIDEDAVPVAVQLFTVLLGCILETGFSDPILGYRRHRHNLAVDG